MRAREFERDLAALSFWTESEIDQCTRQLRAVGSLPTGGRGLNAPDITAEHAAIILIGLAAARRSKDIPNAVETYGLMLPVAEPFESANRLRDVLTLLLTSWEQLKSRFKINGLVVCTTWPEATLHFTDQTGQSHALIYGAQGEAHPGPGMRADVTFSPATLSMLSMLLTEGDQTETVWEGEVEAVQGKT
jgi:hypothetical protein